MRIVIAEESPLQPEVRNLIAELNAALLALTPAEYCYHMTVDEMAGPETTVFIAREDGKAVGCGALRRLGSSAGEVKRMFVKPALQGRGLGGRLLTAIEARASADGIDTLLLETGDRHPAAWRVYERAGFTRRGPFGDYPDTGFSVFYEKCLVAAPPIEG
ncbi:N-acetyltransferase [Aureimonas sp. SA4125]|uniref:GNAT family N-acetyltransferase n=1 Tax=Aureimonas sp. SA4125 TaxID=2826993 RepID=UPI001CC646C6|nr:GNAT family N-acetyltransferase [Aureimonas sp. SA4125]BDA84489.1 N-acetyltransferase [Aureimonas sp. SA4125]